MQPEEVPQGDEPLPEEQLPLRPLTSLKWPYIPETSAYPDPLKRDDPKTLQMHQYEAIGAAACERAASRRDVADWAFAATSGSVRRVLAAHPRLKELLRQVDVLRGVAREETLQRGLGVSREDAPSSRAPARTDGIFSDEEDKLALRELAEAIEAAVRGDADDSNHARGLDWDKWDS